RDDDVEIVFQRDGRGYRVGGSFRQAQHDACAQHAQRVDGLPGATLDAARGSVVAAAAGEPGEGLTLGADDLWARGALFGACRAEVTAMQLDVRYPARRQIAGNAADEAVARTHRAKRDRDTAAAADGPALERHAHPPAVG